MMSTVATKTQYTPEDLLTMPDGNRYELVNGQLVEHDMSLLASYIAGTIQWLLHAFCRENQPGWVLPEGATYQCFADDPGKVQIGLRLRRETPLSVKPISERLRLDTVSSASVRLLSAARQPTASQPAQAGLPI